MASQTTSSSSSSGLGFGGALFIAFLVLKLTGVIDWSWWWVTAPLWIPWAIIGTIFVLTFTVIGIGKLFTRNTRARNRARGRPIR